MEFRKYVYLDKNKFKLSDNVYIPLEKITLSVVETGLQKSGIYEKALIIKFDNQSVNLGKIEHNKTEDLAIFDCLHKFMVSIQIA